MRKRIAPIFGALVIFSIGLSYPFVLEIYLKNSEIKELNQKLEYLTYISNVGVDYTPTGSAPGLAKESDISQKQENGAESYENFRTRYYPNKNNFTKTQNYIVESGIFLVYLNNHNISESQFRENHKEKSVDHPELKGFASFLKLKNELFRPKTEEQFFDQEDVVSSIEKGYPSNIIDDKVVESYSKTEAKSKNKIADEDSWQTSLFSWSAFLVPIIALFLTYWQIRLSMRAEPPQPVSDRTTEYRDKVDAATEST